MIQLFRTNPGLIISIFLMAGCAIVCTLVGFIMARSGASLRPIYWFAGFFALVVIPQFIGHLYIALHATKSEAPRVEALKNMTEAAAPESRGEDAKMLFGPDADPQLVVDARQTFGNAFAQAEFARFASLPNGDTVLLARFNGYSAAEKAWVAYLRDTGLSQLKGQGDSQRGYVVTLPVGDRAYALHMHKMVGVWTGKDDAAIRKRMLAGGFEIPSRAPLGSEPGSASGSGVTMVRPTVPLPFGLGVLVPALLIYLFIVVLYFFKGAGWASSSAAKPGVTPASTAELTARLEAINSVEAPFQVERGTQPNELIATWRYADAKWVDLARARGMRRTFRIRLILDEGSRAVRATDYVGAYDWSAGRGGASVEWKALMGIVFFQYEHQRVFGLLLDEQGKFRPDLSYAYTFNLKEMKSPLVEAVTRAGWNWRPTVWQGPAWLRWLTE